MRLAHASNKVQGNTSAESAVASFTKDTAAKTKQSARTVMFLFGDKGEEDLGDPSTRTIYRDITLKCAKQGEGKLFRTDMPFNKELITFRSFIQIVGAINDYSDDARFQ